MLNYETEKVKKYLLDKLLNHWIIVFDLQILERLEDLYESDLEKIELIKSPSSIQEQFFLFKKTTELEELLQLPNYRFPRLIGIYSLSNLKSDVFSWEFVIISHDTSNTIEFLENYIDKLLKS